MCRRIAALLLVVFACVCVLAVFLPWQRLFFLTDEQAVRVLPAKMLALPLFGLCVLGATWAARTRDAGRRSSRTLPGTVPRSR